MESHTAIISKPSANLSQENNERVPGSRGLRNLGCGTEKPRNENDNEVSGAWEEREASTEMCKFPWFITFLNVGEENELMR